MIVVRSKGHFRADHDGETIIMNLAAGKFFTFDNIGFEIWEAIQEPVQVDALCLRLAEKHKAPAETVLNDVLRFLEKLNEEQLLEVQ
jgi:hypothetical protein